MEILTRRQAAERGLRKYYTGVPCKKGHLTFRNTVTYACESCCMEYNKLNKQKVTEKAILLGSGAQLYELTIHREDIHIVRELIDVLNEWRLRPQGVNLRAFAIDFIKGLSK